MHPRLVATLFDPSVIPPHPRSKALATLASRSPDEARLDAERELARAQPCGCCLTLRIHLTKYIGSTLFTDDDPAALQRAIPRHEHRRWTQRLLAACVVLWGRPRFTPFGRS